MPAADDVTPGEIVRTLRGLQEEIRALRGEHVRRDLYEAHRATVAADIARLDKALSDAENDRKTRNRSVNAALVTAGLSLLVQFIVLLVK